MVTQRQQPADALVLTNIQNRSIINPIKNLCIEVAVQMSTVRSRQAMKYGKGNHRRIFRKGTYGIWGYRKYL